MIKEVEIQALQVGHFVVEISKQREKFSLDSSGYIKNKGVIKHLASKGVQSLMVDLSKSKNSDNSTTKKDLPPILVKLEKAKEIFNQSKMIQKQVFSDAQHGRNLDLGPVEDITNQAIEEIFENADALACVINIRNKDEYLLEHSVSVSVLITIFARFLKIEKKIVQELSVGAFLHDVGKIMVPEEVLNKPGKLTDEEFTVMKTHVNHSIDIIKQTPGISNISLEVAALHHEKLDGNGYPFNVKEKDITTYGRMIAICDIFDALTAHRCYKEGYSHIKAFSILRSLAESNHLDERLVNLFIKCMGVYPVGTLVELNSNKVAIVEERNVDDPTNPKVRSFYNAEKHNYLNTEDIDLATTDDFIVKGVRADDFDLDMNKIIEFLLMEG